MRASKAKPNEANPAVRGELISIGEAVEKYPLAKDWYYRHMEAGTLPFPWYQLSVGKRFMDTADIEAWIEKCKVPAGKLPGETKEVLMK